MEAVWEFVRTVFTSLWGIANIAVVLWFVFIWIQKRGLLLVTGTLVLLVAMAGFAAPDLLTTAQEKVASSPAAWIAESLEALGELLGSVGWAALLLGGLLGAAVLPSIRELVWFTALNNRVAQIALHRDEDAGNRARMQAIQESGFNPAGQLVRMVVTLGALVALWVALRDMEASGSAFSLLGISDLASSALGPAFEVSHILLGLITGAFAGLALYVRRRADTDPLSSKGTIAAPSAAAIWVGASLIAPAGALIAVAGYYAIQIPAAPLLRPSLSSLPRVSAPASTRRSSSKASTTGASAQRRGTQRAERSSRSQSPSPSVRRTGAAPVRGSGPGRSSSTEAAAESSTRLASPSVGAAGEATSAGQRADLLDIMRGTKTRGHRIPENKARSQGLTSQGLCGAPTKSGKPCKNKTVEGSNRCRLHQRK